MLGSVPRGLSLIFHSVVLEFLFGIGIGYPVVTQRISRRKLALVLGAAAIGILLFAGLDLEPIPREFSAGLPSALLVYGMTGLTLRLPSPALLWGEASYVLYLIHLLCFSVLTRLIEPS